MPKSLTSTQEEAINPSLLAFKPRQVLLANRDMKHSKPSSSADGAQTPRPDQKGQLLRAVAWFLESNGFSRTLKKFLSEAGIEKSEVKDSLLDFGEMYCKYSEMCSRGTNVHNEDKVFKDTFHLLVKADKLSQEAKKSKIASGSLADAAAEHQSEQFPGATGKKIKDAVPLKENGVGDSEVEKKPKDKKKKKTKSSMDSVSAGVEQHGLEGKNDANEICKSIADDNPMDEKSVKSKSKKKKKDGLVSESLGGENGKALSIGDMNGTSSGKDDFKISEADATDKENKCSKKRKRLVSEGNDSQPTDNKEDEESNCRMVEGSKASKGSEQPENNDASQGKAENFGELEKRAEKSSKKKSKKQLNGSAEPKTVNAFQRVKADEVEFVDEKLRDNSYWAKDGAEIGYGAKAQEILGQVRGRDFRHEKTKKKRGSYRGGQIDQQSHSVKFNYSEED
ncbi:lisH domain-containing protein-like [Pyrus ussuriensis x Pyrus communis]|uniref:LisH domain-containing protein-like n=1 Tax=Pyrus ussuriensis x Pyrus communis TaxID=2448454 RepID=A0A5N5FAC6_9ROSA|nr:lisH domain-containing protein-like [Pyrus ussuriensis x Pyrus communis]